MKTQEEKGKMEQVKINDKNVDLYINDRLVNSDQYKLLSDNVLTYDGSEKVTGRVWLNKENIVHLLSDMKISGLKESLRYVIGGCKYISPGDRNGFEPIDYGIVIELNEGIVELNSSRDAILLNNQYKDLEKLIVEYISSDDFITDVTRIVNSLELKEFKEYISEIIIKNRHLIRVEDGKIIIDNTDPDKVRYSKSVKRNFTLENFVHNETGFSFNCLIKNIPENDGKTVIFRELKGHDYETGLNYKEFQMMINDDSSYLNNLFIESNIYKINKYVDDVFNGVESPHKLGSLMIHLSSTLYSLRGNNDGVALTFVTDIEDKEELSQIKAMRANIVRMSVNDEIDTNYYSTVVYTNHKKETIEKMLENLGVENSIPVKVETAKTTLKDVNKFKTNGIVNRVKIYK